MKNKKILLVEDQVIIAMTEVRALEKYGYEVLHVLDGESAIESVKRDSNIDLILMDIDLGEGMDGTIAAERILSLRNLPILFLSSHTEPEVVDKTEKISSFGYVVKNLGITVLDASIKMAFKLFYKDKELTKELQLRELAEEEATAARDELQTVLKKSEKMNADLTEYQGLLLSREQKLSYSERLYRTFFNNSNVALAIHEILLDSDDHAVDYRFIDVNPEFEKITGLKKKEIVGKTAREVLPSLEDYWLSVYGKVAKTGESVVFENYSRDLDKHYKVRAFRPQIGQFATFFYDITDYVLLKNMVRSYSDQLNCIMAMSHINKDSSQSLDSVLRKIVDNIPTGWNVGGFLSARIIYNGKCVESNGFIESDLFLSSEILVDSVKIGSVELHYSDKFPDQYESFLYKNELSLLDALSERIGKIIQRKELEESQLKCLGKISSQKTKINFILECSDIGLAEWNVETDEIFFNEKVANFLGYSLDELERVTGAIFGSKINDDDDENLQDLVNSLLKSEIKNFDYTYKIRHKDGNWVWLNCKAMVTLWSDEGKALMVSSVIFDVTGSMLYKDKVEREKSIAFREARHRMKNSMNTIYSLLLMQAEDNSNNDAGVILNDAAMRVQNMMLLDRYIRKPEDDSSVDVVTYITDLTDQIMSFFNRSSTVTRKINIENIEVNYKIISALGLIINELITNSLKHAFPENQQGCISMEMFKRGETVKFIYQDSGPGIPEDVSFEVTGGLGLQLIYMLSLQIKGKIEIERSSAVKIILVFKV